MWLQLPGCEILCSEALFCAMEMLVVPASRGYANSEMMLLRNLAQCLAKKCIHSFIEEIQAELGLSVCQYRGPHIPWEGRLTVQSALHSCLTSVLLNGSGAAERYKVFSGNSADLEGTCLSGGPGPITVRVRLLWSESSCYSLADLSVPVSSSSKGYLRIR